MTIHTTIGVYPNGDCKVNGVDSEHLESHIQYNKDFRVGRALFVDGVCVYKGFVDESVLEAWKEKAKTITRTRCTAPYI